MISVIHTRNATCLDRTLTLHERLTHVGFSESPSRKSECSWELRNESDDWQAINDTVLYGYDTTGWNEGNSLSENLSVDSGVRLEPKATAIVSEYALLFGNRNAISICVLANSIMIAGSLQVVLYAQEARCRTAGL